MNREAALATAVVSSPNCLQCSPDADTWVAWETSKLQLQYDRGLWCHSAWIVRRVISRFWCGQEMLHTPGTARWCRWVYMQPVIGQ